MSIFKKGYLVFILLFLYFLLLIVNINSIYLFIGDEARYSQSVYSLISGAIDSNNHPLFAKSVWAYITFLFHGYLGVNHPLVWRLGTIIFSLGSLVIFYKIAGIFFSKKISLMAVLLLAFDPMYFSFSRLMQLDIISLFFNLASLYFLLIYIKEKENILVLKSGFFLGLSLAAKFSSIALFVLLPIFIFISGKKVKNIISRFLNTIGFAAFSIIGFILGNSAFFLMDHGDTGFNGYVIALFKSQLNLGDIATGYHFSPAWSWFTIPQILTLYRINMLEFSESIIAFQNPLFFASSLFIVALTIFLLFNRRQVRRKTIRLQTLLILIFFGGQYFPWFFNIHPTYYYYIIPLLPLVILLFILVLRRVKVLNKVIYVVLGISFFIFVLYFPMLVGLKVQKKYELILYSYSLYTYAPKDTVFCQNCTPRR